MSQFNILIFGGQPWPQTSSSPELIFRIFLTGSSIKVGRHLWATMGNRMLQKNILQFGATLKWAPPEFIVAPKLIFMITFEPRVGNYYFACKFGHEKSFKKKKYHRITDSERCLELFNRYNILINLFMRYVTMKKKWVRLYTPELSRQSAEWKGPSQN